jgi:hypothetical protein
MASALVDSAAACIPINTVMTNSGAALIKRAHNGAVITLFIM